MLSWCSPGHCCLMMFMLAPTADLLHPSSLSVCLKCASQMFRVYGCWKRSLTWTPVCCSSSFLMSLYQAEVHLRKSECLPAANTWTFFFLKKASDSDKIFRLNFLIVYLRQDKETPSRFSLFSLFISNIN